MNAPPNNLKPLKSEPIKSEPIRPKLILPCAVSVSREACTLTLILIISARRPFGRDAS
jgi:hypothetical protein